MRQVRRKTQVMPHQGALNRHFRFQAILATTVESLGCRQDSIQFQLPRICRKLQRLPSDDFIESASEHHAHALFFCEMRASNKTLTFLDREVSEPFSNSTCEELRLAYLWRD